MITLSDGSKKSLGPTRNQFGAVFAGNTLSFSDWTLGHFTGTFVLDFQDQLSLNADQKYCRMLQGEHSAILSTFI